MRGAAEAGHQVEKIFLKDKHINYCTGCSVCSMYGKPCPQKDDAAEVVEKMIAADVIVMATPVYFYTMSAQMKTLIDRCCARYLEIKDKEFYFIIAAAEESVPMMERTIDGFRGFLDCLEEPKECGTIYGVGAWKVGEINDKPSMHEAYEMGKRYKERILIAIQYIYATYHQTDSCRHLLRTHHAVVPRLHGNTACLVRMDGEDTIPAGRAGTEHRCSTVSCSADLGIRTHLLLRHLPVGSIPGHCFLALRQTEENRFRYSSALKWLRYGVLGVFVLAIIGGLNSFVVLLAPYSSYGRIVSSLFSPLYQWANNGLAYLAERADSYAFYETDVWMKSLPTLLIATVTLVVLIVLAWRGGRTYCNTICPVGTVLGFLSKYSLLKPVIDTKKCNSCGLCARNCKASCINIKAHEIDYSRCVACMDCINKCRKGAITYTRRKPASAAVSQETSVAPEQVNDARRAFLSTTAVFAATAALKAQEKKVDGGLAVIEDKKIPERATPITPPGSLSARHFAQHCTACQLCVSVCPNQVLRPSSDLTKLMQPEMSYERGYCRPECAKCAEVCPTDAIHLTSLAEKSAVQIGHAVWIKENCICITDKMECGNCARHCPAGAIQMVPSDPEDEASIKIPVVNAERCIGCGACENLCPSRPFSAIYVEGHVMHRTV